MSTHPEFTVYVKQRSFTHSLPPGTTLRVGRGVGVHICVEDPSVSREHLLIHVEENGIEVEDLGSSNGTVIIRSGNKGSGEALRVNKRYSVVPGDMIRLGSVPTLVQSAESSTAPDRVTSPPLSGRNRILVDPDMKRLYELAERAAASEIGVLILGETGVGKELLASHVHENSPRAKGPFLQLNCAALAESLLESELFGHEKGAFTGAARARPGLLESATGGTIFLDELGEMPLSIQAKLLRVLEERQIRRLGATRNIDIDVRFVAATNRNLGGEVKAGRFRSDLYYRINGLSLEIPPLRRRQFEIEPLARYFLHEFCVRSGIAEPEITQDGLRALLQYPWPGNVRELKNVMERSPLLSAGMPLLAEHLPRYGEHLVLDDQDFLDDEHTDVGLIPLDLSTPALGDFQRPRGLEAAVRARVTQQRMTPANVYRMALPPSKGELMVPAENNMHSLPPGAVEFGSSQLASVTPSQTAPAVKPGGGLTHGNSRSFSEFSDRESIVCALEECSGNQTRAAKMLGVSRRTLINRIEAFDLPRPRKR